MARPIGATSDPIGKIFTRVEKDIKYVTARYKALRLAYQKMKKELRLNKKMGL